MAAEQQRLKSIFDEAAEIASLENRAAYLERACGGDADLRRKVDALLLAFDQAGSFMEASPALDMGSLTATYGPSSDASPLAAAGTDRLVGLMPSLVEGPGSLIGPYKLLQQIGEGGMGAVFMAEQEKPVRRKVALKVIKPGMDTGQVIARFEAERQALAIMDHPHIARVLDAGATESGRPYFVMELVKGVPITEYCDRNHLTPKERLELFIPVCQAIQHAHQKGIIHRDIKPSNVLVTLHDGKPMPKVIDFGVAKAVDQRLTEKTMFTEFGQVIGTLEYMSPEQAEMGALDIDTRSDIYSLGVMLYELLTGSTPLERVKLRQATYADILKRIREEEPTKPSTRLSESKESLPSISAQRKMEPARLTKLVRGDLDWIVMKSLEKDRTRRYETANGLAKDIQRYLDGDAVEASPPSATYKIRKFARKHRTALATAAAFAILLVAAAAVSIALALRANRERTRAEEREQMAIDAVKRFRDAVADEPALKNAKELEDLRKRLLKEPLGFFRALRDRLQADHDTRPESLDRLAVASYQLAKLTSEIGDTEDALFAYRESLAITERLAAAKPSDTRLQENLVSTLNPMGILLRETGKPEEARAANERALQILEAHPDIPQIEKLLAGTQLDIGNVLKVFGKPAEALAAFKKANAIYEKLASASSTETLYHLNLAAVQASIGDVLSKTGRPAEALAAYERALEIRQKLADSNPAVAEFQANLSATYAYSICPLLSTTGKPEEALHAFKSALAIMQRVADSNPTVTSYQDRLSGTYHNLGFLLKIIGKTDEALAAYKAARAIMLKLADSNPTVVDFQDKLAHNHHRVGQVLNETGKLDDAMKAFESALAIQQKLADSNPTKSTLQSELGRTLHSIAILLGNTSKIADAMKAHTAALQIQQKLVDQNPSVTDFQSELASSHQDMGRLHYNIGHSAEAMKAFGLALAIQQKLANENPSVTSFQSDLADTHEKIGAILSRSSKHAEAMDEFLLSLKIEQKLVDANPTVADLQSRLANIHQSIGNCLSSTGKPAEAIKSLTQALEIQQKLADAHPTDSVFQLNLSETHASIGIVLARSGKLDEAIKSLALAIEIGRKLAEENPKVAKFWLSLSQSYQREVILLLDRGKPAEAMKATQAAFQILQKLVDEDSSVPEYRSSLAKSLCSMGDQLSAAGKPAEALKAFESALKIRQKLVDDSPAFTDYRDNLARTYSDIGSLKSSIGKPTEAIEAHQKAADMAQKLVDDSPSVVGYRQHLAASQNDIGLLLQEIGKPAEAMKAFGPALTIRENLAQEHPDVPNFASDLGGVLNNIAMIDLSAKRFDAARDRLLTAIVWQRKALAANPVNPTYRRFLSSHLANLVQAAHEERDLKEAVTLLRELTSEYPDVSRLPSELGVVLQNLAVMDLRAKRFDAAAAGLREAAIWQRKALAASPTERFPRSRLTDHLENLRQAASGLGLAEEADQAFREINGLRSSAPEAAAFNARLAAVLKGEDCPKNNAERLVLAQLTYDKSLFAASARFLSEALASDPKLAEDRVKQHAYNAACAAALAASSQGKDDPAPDDVAKVKLRKQALEWLRSELSIWTKVIDGGQGAWKAEAAKHLAHWKEDFDLAGIRDEKALAGLPEKERAFFKTLWNDVDQLLARARMNK